MPKYVITNLKSTILRKNNQQEYLIAIFVSQTNPDEHVSLKINKFIIYKGVWGEPPPPPQAEEIFKKSNKMEAFPYFFPFWQGSLYPQNYELALYLP